MADYKLKSQLLGHSGCKIFLMENGDNECLVRKFSKDIAYNARLKLQYEKQKRFCNPGIKAPKIFSCGFDNDGLFYFDMEYIRGITLSEYIKNMNVNEIGNIVDILTSQIRNINDEIYENNSQAFLDKIEDLMKKLDAPLMLKGLEFLSQHDWKKFPHTFCHGDLTLENILVCRGNFYFIDFLDSFYDCFILDFATLLQDVHCMWHYRFEKTLDTNTKIRLIIFRDLLMKKISAYGISAVDVYCALLLKLIRIYPYTKDSITLKFLNTKVEQVMKLIENNNLEGL